MERGALTHSDLAPPMQPYRENPRLRRQARVAAAGREAARAARAAITTAQHSSGNRGGYDDAKSEMGIEPVTTRCLVAVLTTKLLGRAHVRHSLPCQWCGQRRLVCCVKRHKWGVVRAARSWRVQWCARRSEANRGAMARSGKPEAYTRGSNVPLSKRPALGDSKCPYPRGKFSRLGVWIKK